MELADIKPGQFIEGMQPGEVAEVKFVEQVDDGIVKVHYKTATGYETSKVLSGGQAKQLILVSGEWSPSLSASAEDFKMASEATRISLAGLFDPLSAVNSSDLEPLPHQIHAVYGELLPKIPLRYLLADDPGAGKTIMAGLYIKELILRGQLRRCLIVVPGGLIDQWQQELFEKFNLTFQALKTINKDDLNIANPFLSDDLVIARMDQLARADEDVLSTLDDSYWDLVIVDEAHRMSASYSGFGGGLKETRRYSLGKRLSVVTSGFLLMTATPHSGNQANFEAFLALLDPDMFAGKPIHSQALAVTEGTMRRLVKEDLLTFDGTPLFPPRRSQSVEYEFSPQEKELYELVTEYVKTEMNRAKKVADTRVQGNIGFALTVLQRRLASSPLAIRNSLSRRLARLKNWLSEVEDAGEKMITVADDHLSSELDYDELSPEELERADEEFGSAKATAARTVEELKAEISSLESLEAASQKLLESGDDRKWLELKSILESKPDGNQEIDKIIIFTEHKDTLDYLTQRLGELLGDPEALVEIHGGMSRRDRLDAKGRFTNEAKVRVLVATDAAGEGLNLQRAHFMVNYDLPWNPNRIEQRFGRIHRIGQTEVCFLWNLIAKNSREGQVFSSLFKKIQAQSDAYNGNIFPILGINKPFDNKSLSELLIEAIQAGQDPEVQKWREKIIDQTVGDAAKKLADERALYEAINVEVDPEEIARQITMNAAKKLQPGFIQSFFMTAFEKMHGKLHMKDNGVFEITYVPDQLRQLAHKSSRVGSIERSYENVVFQRGLIRQTGRPDASLIAPGHPLLEALTERVENVYGKLVSEGSILVDRTESQRDKPFLLFTVQQIITNSTEEEQTVLSMFEFADIDSEGNIGWSIAPQYLDFEPPTQLEEATVRKELVADFDFNKSWKAIEASATKRALSETLVREQEEVSLRIGKIREQVQERLENEINNCKLREQSNPERASHKNQETKSQARKRREEFESRLDQRLKRLQQEESLQAKTPKRMSVALVVPERALRKDNPEFAKDLEAKKAVERRAVDLVMEAEREVGRVPEEMPPNNKGFDIRSLDANGLPVFIEVKGRADGADKVTVTASEVSFAQTNPDRHFLAMVKVSENGKYEDRLSYLERVFDGTMLQNGVASITIDLDILFDKGFDPRDS